jgi:hypothetical protein
MFIIEKTSEANIKAYYERKDSHKWVRAWKGAKAVINNCSMDNAIKQFFEYTNRVRKASYRLRRVECNTVLASINTLDADFFRKYTSATIDFINSVNPPAKVPVIESIGVAVPNSLGFIVGSCANKSSEVKDIVDGAYHQLFNIIGNYEVITRYNSDGLSGGAWLKTSPLDMILSNTDVGITFSKHTGDFKLIVNSKFLSSESYGNTESRWSNQMDHESKHASVDSAIEMLKMVAKK